MYISKPRINQTLNSKQYSISMNLNQSIKATLLTSIFHLATGIDPRESKLAMGGKKSENVQRGVVCQELPIDLATPTGTGTSEAAPASVVPFFVFLRVVGWWVALALRAIEQRGYRAWLKPATPFGPCYATGNGKSDKSGES